MSLLITKGLGVAGGGTGETVEVEVIVPSDTLPALIPPSSEPDICPVYAQEEERTVYYARQAQCCKNLYRKTRVSASANLYARSS